MAVRSVSALLESIHLASEEFYGLVQAVRLCVQQSCRAISEEVKYGGILFSSEGLPFGGVYVYRQHVSVELSCGASITDSYGHLEGSGKGRRHIKLRSIDDINGKHLAAYLTLAVLAAQEQAGHRNPLE